MWNMYFFGNKRGKLSLFIWKAGVRTRVNISFHWETLILVSHRVNLRLYEIRGWFVLLGNSAQGLSAYVLGQTELEFNLGLLLCGFRKMFNLFEHRSPHL